MRDFGSIWSNLLKHCISADFSLTVALVQSALRKEMLITHFVERFNTPTLEKSYLNILPVLGKNYLDIAFLSIFC